MQIVTEPSIQINIIIGSDEELDYPVLEDISNKLCSAGASLWNLIITAWTPVVAIRPVICHSRKIAAEMHFLYYLASNKSVPVSQLEQHFDLKTVSTKWLFVELASDDVILCQNVCVCN